MLTNRFILNKNAKKVDINTNLQLDMFISKYVDFTNEVYPKYIMFTNWISNLVNIINIMFFNKTSFIYNNLQNKVKF